MTQPSAPPRLLIASSLRWGFLWQRHQSFAAAAAAAGWEVDWLQPRATSLRRVLGYPLRRLRGETAGIGRAGTTAEHEISLPGVRVLDKKHWLTVRGPYELALVYVPDAVTEWMLRRVRPGRTVYDAVLDWASVPSDWAPPTGWRTAERRLHRRLRADITTDSPGMAAVLKARGLPARVIPPAVDDAFLPVGPEEWGSRRRRALYFGAVREEVDTDAMLRLAASGVPIDVIGVVPDPGVRDVLEAAGISVTGPVPVTQIGALARSYRAVLLPYRGARTASLAPAKLFNAVATGAWVLTSGIDVSGLPPESVVPLTPAFSADELRTLWEAPPPNPSQSLPSWADRWRELSRADQAVSGPR